MEKEAVSAIQAYTPYIVAFNFVVAAAILMVLGRFLGRGQLTDDVPGERQNLAEFVLNFFVTRAHDVGDGQVVRIVAPFLATCFLLILVSNLFVVIPIPLLNHPPTAYFSVTLALAICAVGGTLVISGVLNGLKGAVGHLVWPNPLQLISEFTDVMSLSLRLFGNIGGEYMTLVLVSQSVAIGIPLILHVLGLIPAFVQALVFTLLTTSFVAGVVHAKEHESAADSAIAEPAEAGPAFVEGETPAMGVGA
jgi:F-type H+-transporting ATPase subunit a